MTPAVNVLFDETRVHGFKNETRSVKDDLAFDASFDGQISKPDNQGIVNIEIKKKTASEPLVEAEHEKFA